jgi:hypothetical protein
MRDATAKADPNAEPALAPGRRLDAIAEIFARGLARALLAKDPGTSGDDARDAQPPGNAPESALIDAPERALVVARGGDCAADQGGRRR